LYVRWKVKLALTKMMMTKSEEILVMSS